MRESGQPAASRKRLDFKTVSCQCAKLALHDFFSLS